MKNVCLLFCCLGISTLTFCQLGNVLERAKARTKAKVNQKIDQKIDKTVDKGLNDAENAGTNKKNGSTATNPESTAGESAANGGTPAPASFQSYSKFDFVPGEKLVTAEDFSQDAIGDFPARWNTNGSGEVVTTNLAPGRFIKTQKEIVFYPEWVKDLPDNFTLEFDLVSTEAYSYYSGHFVVGFNSSKDVGANFSEFGNHSLGKSNAGGGFEVAFHPQSAGGGHGTTTFLSHASRKEIIKNDAHQDEFKEGNQPIAHISIWRQNQRVRVYMDQKKVWDLPKALPASFDLNSLYFRNEGSPKDNEAYFIGNIRLAVGAPDTRNKLITEGKFVTHGILFAVNSDKIEPTSYGAIKDIANVLTENATVRVQIVGHTDSDGADAANLQLSKKRAEAVKETLVNEFGISAARLTADGKGESAPVTPNSSSEGKANNRRVEFIKQ